MAGWGFIIIKFSNREIQKYKVVNSEYLELTTLFSAERVALSLEPSSNITKVQTAINKIIKPFIFK